MKSFVLKMIAIPLVFLGGEELVSVAGTALQAGGKLWLPASLAATILVVWKSQFK